jgi:hypothetical protein
MATLVWTGVALWFGLNAAFVALRMYVTRSERAVAPVLVWNRQIS